MNPIMQQVKEAIRHPWTNGYPVYVVMADGELMCEKCAKKNFRQIVENTKMKSTDWPDTSWKALGAEVLWETEEENAICCDCNKELESAYGIVERGN